MQRSGGHFRLVQQIQQLSLGLVGTPLRHDVVEDVPIGPAAVVVGEARIVEKIFTPDQPAPAFEHGLACHLQQHPLIVSSAIQVAWRDRGALVAHPGLVSMQQFALDQKCVRQHQRRRQQRPLHVLSLARPVAVVERHHHPDRKRERRAEVGVGHHGSDRLVGQALPIHRARHDLSRTVEPDLGAVRSAFAVCRGAGQDDVRFDRLERVVIQAAGPHRRGRHVGDHDVGAGDQPPSDLRTFACRGIQGE